MKKYVVTLVHPDDYEDDRIEVEIESTDAISAMQQAEKANYPYMGWEAEEVEGE